MSAPAPPSASVPGGAAPAPRLVPWALLAIVLGAGALRLWNIDFGDGRRLHPNEAPKARMARALARDGLVDHRYFNHPYLLIDTVAVAGRIATAARWVDDGVRGYMLAGRWAVAVLGTLTTAAAFLLAREAARGTGPAAGAGAGLAAAAMTAAVPLHVVHSRYVKEDVPLALALTLAAWACVRLARGGARRDLFLAGLFCGLAVSTKFVGGTFLAVAAAAAAVGRRALAPEARPRTGTTLAALVLVPAAVFAVTNLPWIVFASSAVQDLAVEIEHAGGSAIHPPVSPWAEWWTYHLRESLLPGFTPPALLAALAGAAAMAATRERGRLVLVGAAALWYGVHEAVPLKPLPNTERYMVPLAPLLAAAAGWCVALGAGPLAGAGRRGAATVALLLPAVGIGWAGVTSARLASEMKPDTRESLPHWLHANLGRGALVVSDHYGIGGMPAPGIDLYVLDYPRAGETYAGPVDPETWTLHRAPVGDAPQRRPIDAVVTSSFWSGAWIHGRETDDPVAREARAFYARVERELGPPAAIMSAPSGPYAYQNPELRVYLVPRRGGDRARRPR